MVLVLMLLMAYSLIGETTHEVLGIFMFCLFILHQMFNKNWYHNLGKGHYNSIRILMTGVNLLIFLLMVSQMISGVLLSKHLFAFSVAVAHISNIRLVSYWLFALTALHDFDGALLAYQSKHLVSSVMNCRNII